MSVAICFFNKERSDDGRKVKHILQFQSEEPRTQVTFAHRGQSGRPTCQGELKASGPHTRVTTPALLPLCDFGQVFELPQLVRLQVTPRVK